MLVTRKRKQGGLSLEEEDEEDARKKKEDELWASFLNDVGPKSKVPASTHVKVS